MKFYVGYAFTEEPIHQLRQYGFDFFSADLSESHGYREFNCVLENNKTLQIREILDEDIYLKKFNIEHFTPFEINLDILLPISKNSNGVYACLGMDEKNLDPEILHDVLSCLKLRKPFALKFVSLITNNFSLFEKQGQSDRIFESSKKKAALLHLGPSCYDFVVTE